MNAYVIHITVGHGQDPALAHARLVEAIATVESMPSAAVETFYAVASSAYDYIAIVDVVRVEDAVQAAAYLAINGMAKTSVSPATTVEAYAEVLAVARGKRP